MGQASDFNTFIKETVNLNQTRLDLLSRRVTAIETFLTGDEVFKDHVTELVPQGSFAHGTIIKPVGNKEFDADVLVPLDEIDGWSAEDYVQRLYEAFGRSATYRTMRSRHNRCVRIDYAGEFHVDVVPFVTRSASTYVTKRRSNEFEPSAPDDFSEWLEGKNRITGGNLAKVVRLLKYLRDHKTRYTIPSVTLTAALAHHVSEAALNADPNAYDTVAITLRTLSEELAVQVAGHPDSAPYVRDPGTGQDLADRWKDENYRTFRTVFTSYAGKIGDACDEPDYAQALTIWRDLFGDAFGSNGKSASLTAASVSKSLELRSEQFLDRDFGIPEDLNHEYRFKTVGYVVPRKGFRDGPLPKRGDRIGKGRSLKFRIEHSNVPEPYNVYWKIRNYGEEAERADSLRGDIHEDDGTRTRSERTSYLGHHYVEAMIVKDGVCVAKSRQEVIVI